MEHLDLNATKYLINWLRRCRLSHHFVKILEFLNYKSYSVVKVRKDIFIIEKLKTAAIKNTLRCTVVPALRDVGI